MRYQEPAFDVPDDKALRVIIDTDAANEADDQYAIVQALLSPRLDIDGCNKVFLHYINAVWLDSSQGALVSKVEMEYLSHACQLRFSREKRSADHPPGRAAFALLLSFAGAQFCLAHKN